jgi:two-component system, OmpR family, sensor kinase
MSARGRGRMLGRLSLRARLILGVIVLAAAGLLAADLVTYTELRSFEISRTDQALDAAHGAIEAGFFGGTGPPGGGGGGGNPSVHAVNAVPPPPSHTAGLHQNGPFRPRIGPLADAARGYYVELLTPGGKVVSSRFNPQVSGEKTPSSPKLPATIKFTQSRTGPDRVAYFTVGAKKGDTSYRVRASVEPNAPDMILVLAAPLAAVDSTLHRLFVIELIATVAVLVGIALLGLWVVRLGLRPLEAMGKTATAIAGGDLSQRVERADQTTEVGRLGLALNSMLAHIEEAVTERDESLSALEASESKLRRFVADASHELRTPLAAVRAYAELFTRGAADRPADLERSMKGITRESERMSVLVEDLLLLAHLDEGRPLTLEPVRLDEVVGEALETARTLEPERPLDVELEPTLVSGDRDRLRQVIDNLLSNIRAHTPADAPLRVAVERNDSVAILTVADSGPGLDRGQLAHVFERFYRADPSRARSSGGAGLGLAIVSAVVGAHGGTVTAASEPGHGTTFRVELPLAPTHA